jgi:hypothetical protein
MRAKVRKIALIVRTIVKLSGEHGGLVKFHEL